MTNIESASTGGLTGAVAVDLGDGVVVLVSPTVVDEGDLREVSWRDQVDADGFFESIRRFCASLTEALSAAAPTKITAEFGVKAGVKAGKLTALLVDGKGEASVLVTLEWDRSGAE